MNDNNRLDESNLFISSEGVSNNLTTGSMSVGVTLPENIIRLLTKQADLEANFIFINLRNLEQNVSLASMNSFDMLESYLRSNFPNMHPPVLANQTVGIWESFFDLISGQSFGSILAKGKILNTLVTMNVNSYDVDYEQSLESIFKEHFVYTKDNFVRKEDLSSHSAVFFKPEESEGIVNFSKMDEILNDSTGLFWRDNAPVDISYKTSNSVVTLKFINGRQVDTSSNYLNQAPEIDYNLNLMIARYIESNYKFTGLVDNPRFKPSNLIERNFKDDAIVIHEETKKEFSELILPLVKAVRKIHITDYEKELIMVGSEDDRIVYITYDCIYFSKYNIRVTVEPSLYHSTYRYHKKDSEINFNEFKQNLGDSLNVKVIYVGDDKIVHSTTLGSFILKPNNNEESFNSIEFEKNNLNDNFFLSNYVLRSILEEYKEDILKSVSEFLK